MSTGKPNPDALKALYLAFGLWLIEQKEREQVQEGEQA